MMVFQNIGNRKEERISERRHFMVLEEEQQKEMSNHREASGLQFEANCGVNKSRAISHKHFGFHSYFLQIQSMKILKTMSQNKGW